MKMQTVLMVLGATSAYQVPAFGKCVSNKGSSENEAAYDCIDGYCCADSITIGSAFTFSISITRYAKIGKFKI